MNDTNTAWTVSCRRKDYAGVKVVVLGAELITKKLSTIILSWVIFCVGKLNKTFIRATVKAAFMVFLSLPCSLK